MADVQLENGYLSIANELWEALTRAALTGCEYQIVMAIIRETYGWQRKSATISLSRFTALTGIANSGYLSRLTSSLAQRHIITKASEWGKTTAYAINKDFDTWTIAPQCSTTVTCNSAPKCKVSTAQECNGSTALECNSLHVIENHVKAILKPLQHEPDDDPDVTLRRQRLETVSKLCCGRPKGMLTEFLTDIAELYTPEVIDEAIAAAKAATPGSNAMNWIRTRCNAKTKELTEGGNGGYGRGRNGIRI